MAPKKRRDESMKKVPSIAPTMAIAPSDYEHIYHEGGAKNPAADNGGRSGGREDRSGQRAERSTGRSQSTRPANVLPKMTVGGGITKLPSNAPTMAIAPSDYEHIYHQGQEPAPKPTKSPDRRSKSRSRSPSPDPTTDYDNEGGARAGAGTGAGAGVIPAPMRPLPPMPQLGPEQVLASPDGYTMLGRKPDPNSRGVALPPHIVRANNQFSRAVLQRVAKFLATKADPTYY